ncbi:trichohyalin-like [Thunnus albacares]|uniref:trichohyalin-like n=1 Tax=Thunnus albacares TaxID=8236 RepID=UPI001CF6E792|nr:trichohyalin-like [Thunnus albacares]
MAKRDLRTKKDFRREMEEQSFIIERLTKEMDCLREKQETLVWANKSLQKKNSAAKRAIKNMKAERQQMLDTLKEKEDQISEMSGLKEELAKSELLVTELRKMLDAQTAALVKERVEAEQSKNDWKTKHEALEKSYQQELASKERSFKMELSLKEESFKCELSEKEETFTKKLSKMEETFNLELSERKQSYENKLSEEREFSKQELSKKEESFRTQVLMMEVKFKKQLIFQQQRFKQRESIKKPTLHEEVLRREHLKMAECFKEGLDLKEQTIRELTQREETSNEEIKRLIIQNIQLQELALKKKKKKRGFWRRRSNKIEIHDGMMAAAAGLDQHGQQ